MSLSSGEVGLDPVVRGTPLQLFSGDLLQYAIVFLVLALVAAVLGARGVAGLSMTIAKWLVIVFVVLALVSLVLRITVRSGTCRSRRASVGRRCDCSAGV